MEFLGTTQVASYCGRKSCLFPELPPTSITYQSYYQPGYCHLSCTRPSLLRKVVPVSCRCDQPFIPTGPPTVVPALRSSLHARYSTHDWHCANLAQLQHSEAHRSSAGRLNADSWRMMREKDTLTYQMQEDSKRNLGERITTIDFWRSELTHELECLLAETEDLETLMKRLHCSADEIQALVKTALECLYNREKRQGIDLVHDDVEKNLMKEADLFKDLQEILRKLAQEIGQQLA